MAKAGSGRGAAKAKNAPPARPNRERPPEPKRYEASRDELLEFYRQMLLIRRFEERAGQLYGLGLIGGFCHLYIGQEAVAVGLQSALDTSLSADLLEERARSLLGFADPRDYVIRMER